MSITIKCFWHGPPLSYLHKICLQSFIAHGHGVELYSYGPVAAVPGVAAKDAGAVMPVEELFYFRDPQTGRADISPFVDLFRLKLLQDLGGWWCDIDTICLSDAVPDLAYAWSRDYPSLNPPGVSNGLLAFPKEDPIVRNLYDRARASGSQIAFREQLGTQLLSRTLMELGLPLDVGGDFTSFCPLVWIEVFKLWLPEFAAEIEKRTEKAQFLPIYGSIPKSIGIDLARLPPSASFLDRIYERHAIDEDETQSRYEPEEIRTLTREWILRHPQWTIPELVLVAGKNVLDVLEIRADPGQVAISPPARLTATPEPQPGGDNARPLPSPSRRLRIIVMGWLVRGPLGGMAWHYLHYLGGFAELGHDVYYIEDSGDRLCSDPALTRETTDPTIGLEFASQVFHRLGFGDRWAYYDAHAGEWKGARAHDARQICQSADLVLNVSGVNPLRDWFDRVPVRALIDTDPGFTQLNNRADERARRDCAAHNVFFSYGESKAPFGPVPDDGFHWRPTRQPVWLAAWPFSPGPIGGRFTTVMQWDSCTTKEWGDIRLGMKLESFPRFFDLPRQCDGLFSIAIRGKGAPLRPLRDLGWEIADIDAVSRDPWSYQAFIQSSKGELGIAKQGYVVTRSGWFSERSANYLASGRPVLHQDTGFADFLPCGNGLFAFNSIEEVAQSIRRIELDYEAHCRAARQIAEEHFASRHVLGRLIEDAGRDPAAPLRAGRQDAKGDAVAATSPSPDAGASSGAAVSRSSERIAAERRSPLSNPPLVSVAICTTERYNLLKQAVASLLRQTLDPSQYEILVIDNSANRELSEEMSGAYSMVPNLRWFFEEVAGESHARNVALSLANSPLIAFLDDDAIARPDWLGAIVRAFDRLGTDTVAVGGKVTPLWGAPRPAWLHEKLLAYLSVIDWGDKGRPIAGHEWLVAANLAFRVSRLKEIGGFRTDLGRRPGEETLLSNCEMDAIDALRRRGYTVFYEPAAAVDHFIPESRLSQSWMRRRVVWQAISDYLKDPSVHFRRAESARPLIEAFMDRSGPAADPIALFCRATEDPVAFHEQMSALARYTMLLLTGFDGMGREPPAAQIASLAAGIMRETQGPAVRSPAAPASDPPSNATGTSRTPSSRPPEDRKMEHSAPEHQGQPESGSREKERLRAFLDSYRKRLPESRRGYFDIHYRRFLYTMAGIPAAEPGAAALDVGTDGLFLLVLRDLFGYERVEGTIFNAPGPEPVTLRRSYEFDPEAEPFALHNLDLENCPVPAGPASFDFVLAAELIQYFATDPNAFFFEANRLLKPGGRLLLTTANVACAENIFRILWRQIPHRYYYYRKDGSRGRHNLEYGPDLLKQTVENAGFAVARMWDENCWSEPRPEIIRMIRDAGFPEDLRGDDIMFLCVKTGQPRERFPDFLYA